MSDNTQLNQGIGGDVIATDDLSGVKHQLVKVEFGVDGAATMVSASDPLPVTGVITGTVAVTQSGTWTVTGAGGTFPVTGTFWQATQPVSLASVPSHDVTNAGTFAVQAVCTASNLDIRDLTSVSDSVSAVQSGTWNIGTVTTVSAVTAISNALPAGNNNIGDVDAIQSGTWNITNVSGTVSLPTGASTLAEQQTQTTALQLLDDAVYTDGTGTPSKALGIAGTDGTNPQIVKVDSNGELQVDVLSMPTTTVTATDLDVRDLTSASDSVAAVQSGTWNIGTVTAVTAISNALPAGTNAIGKLAANSGVDIGDVDVTSIAAGDNNIGNVDIVTVPAPLSTTGGGTEATALRVTVASDSTGVLSVDDNGGSLTVDGTVAATNTALTNFGAGEYETVAASQTAQVLGGTGGIGDYISGVLVVPASTSPGNVLLLDNATSITIFAGGASSVSNLVPFFIPLGMISVSGAWKLTTGASVSCIGIGNFTA